MKTEYLPSFIKDLKKLKKTSVYPELQRLAFEIISNCKDISKIPNLKKIKGHKYAYRVRVGDYRLGIFINNEIVTFSRILHRKDVYRYFP